MKTWLKGGLIGTGIALILVLLFFGCFYINRGCIEEWCGIECLIPMMPFSYLSSITGADYFIFVFNNLYIMFITGTITFILFGTFIGFLFDKEYSWKKKLTFFIILLLIFVPLSSYSQYLKYRDKRILSENFVGGSWQNLDFSMCNKISVFNEFQRENCFVKLIEKKPELKICPELTQATNKDKCHIEIGKIKKDDSFCNYVELPLNKDTCYYELSNATSNENLCKMIKNPVLFNQCYSNVAQNKKDISICDNLDKDGKSSCYYDVAIFTKNPKICLEFEDSVKVNLCYIFIASKLNNPLICENIKEELFKKDCYSSIDVYRKD